MEDDTDYVSVDVPPGPAEVGMGLDLKLSEHYQAAGGWVSVKLTCPQEGGHIRDAQRVARELCIQHLELAAQEARAILDGLIAEDK